MLLVAAKDTLCFLRSAPPFLALHPPMPDHQSSSLVRLVHIFHLDDGQVPVIAKVSKRDPSARLDSQFVDALLRRIEADGHAEEVAIG